MKQPPLSLYVHLPWCVRKCPYCDFNSYTAGEAAPRARYLRALEADLALEGELEMALGLDARDAVEQDFAETLRAKRRRDAEAGRALTGPHRSDLAVTYSAKGRPARLCSTGEQKALLIGLVLANARALSLSDPDAPLILLLDEIAAHLDPDRRAALFAIIDDLGFQAFMTGTDCSLFDAWGARAQHFDVADGVVSETKPT